MRSLLPSREQIREAGPWMLMYAVSVALHIPGMFARGIVFYVGSWIALKITGWGGGSDADVIATIAVFGPLAWSLLTLISPVAAVQPWRMHEGGREPSTRERDAYQQAIDELRETDPQLRLPARWFVLDDDAPNAATLGNTLMISRGLLQSEYLAAVVAHELGHVNTDDARLSAALYRLEFLPWLYGIRSGTGLIHQFTGLWTGIFGSWLMSRVWAAWFRDREYAADAYAAHLGQGPQLAQMLETEALPADGPVPFRWLAGPSHPPTELRLDRLSR